MAVYDIQTAFKQRVKKCGLQSEGIRDIQNWREEGTRAYSYVCSNNAEYNLLMKSMADVYCESEEKYTHTELCDLYFCFIYDDKSLERELIAANVPMDRFGDLIVDHLESMAPKSDMNNENTNEESYKLISYRQQAKTAAKQLLYGDEVIQRIEQAKTVAEITRIMKQARLNKQWPGDEFFNAHNDS